MMYLKCDNPKCGIMFFRCRYNSSGHKSKLHFCSNTCKFDFMQNIGYTKKKQNNKSFMLLMKLAKLKVLRKNGVTFRRLITLSYAELCIIDVCNLKKDRISL